MIALFIIIHSLYLVSFQSPELHYVREKEKKIRGRNLSCLLKLSGSWFYNFCTHLPTAPAKVTNCFDQKNGHEKDPWFEIPDKMQKTQTLDLETTENFKKKKLLSDKDVNFKKHILECSINLQNKKDELRW